jgi:hypothetical protein
MKKEINVIFICFLFLIALFPLNINVYALSKENNNNSKNNPLDGGWLEQRNGVKILHISGSPYELGYQHGYLLKDEISENFRAVINSANIKDYDKVIDWWNNYCNHNTPQEYIEEMHGIADGSGMSFEDVIVFFGGWLLLIENLSCMDMAAWDSATEDGRLYQMRSWDINPQARDPDTGTYLHNNQILIVRQPEGALASLSVTLAGNIGISGGMNEIGISISSQISFTTDVTENKTQPPFRLKMVLDHAISAEEAIDIMNASRTGYANYIISDGKIPNAYIFEETASYSYIGTWNHPVESNPPFWSIDHVVRRKNFFINPFTANTQRDIYDPRFYLILSLLPDNINYFNPWRYYRTLSLEIDELWGNLNLNNTMSMLRSIYRGETDIFLFIFWKIGQEKFGAYHQWVACPETGDIVISYAHDDQRAQYNMVHYFNMFELLDSEPPP